MRQRTTFSDHLLDQAPVRARLAAVRLAAVVVLLLSCVSFAAFGLVLMQCAERDVAHVDGGLAASLVVFVAAALTIVIVEVRRITHRFEHPEHQVRVALQRIRNGDVGFRVSLRRGDPLARIAFECNELLDWLNVNPPTGVRTGSDIVDISSADGDEEARP